MTDDQSGWTLLEMLVALSLLALIGALVGSSLQISRVMLQRGHDVEAGARVDAVRDYLRRTIVGIRPFRRPKTALNEPLILTGEDRIVFISGFTPVGQYQGIYVVEWALRPSSVEGRYDMVEVRTPYRPTMVERDETQPLSVEPVILLEAVARLQWRYFGSIEDDGGKVWQGDWRHRSRLPSAIAVDVAWNDGSRRSWPTLAIHVPTAD